MSSSSLSVSYSPRAEAEQEKAAAAARPLHVLLSDIINMVSISNNSELVSVFWEHQLFYRSVKTLWLAWLHEPLLARHLSLERRLEQHRQRAGEALAHRCRLDCVSLLLHRRAHALERAVLRALQAITPLGAPLLVVLLLLLFPTRLLQGDVQQSSLSTAATSALAPTAATGALALALALVLVYVYVVVMAVVCLWIDGCRGLL
jgi:hypothetical protein